MADSPAESKLHIDSDWKAQAQAEKDRLARQEAEREAKGSGRGKPGEMPPADFRSLVGVLASQAMSGLGVYGDEKGRLIVDPVGAKFSIDLLGVLEEKTRGNLAKEEAEELTGILQELRVRFVQVVELLARQAAGGAGGPAIAGAVSPGTPGGSGPGGETPPAGPRIVMP